MEANASTPVAVVRQDSAEGTLMGVLKQIGRIEALRTGFHAPVIKDVVGDVRMGLLKVSE